MNFYLAGFVAAVWLVVGVTITAKRYPGYSHQRQFLSELGAAQSPTQKFSPRIGNFPLSVLFVLFGISLINTPGFFAIGVCVVLHGVGTLVAGLFSMDADPQTKSPSTACRIHLSAGLVMFFALLVASLLAIFNPALGATFQILSAIAVACATTFTIKQAQELKHEGSNIGLYQRLGYGTQLVWLAYLSLALFYRSQLA